MDSWSAGAAAHSREMSVGYRQTGPGQHSPACSDESKQILKRAAAACSSRLLSDSACFDCPPTTGLNTNQLSGRQLWFAFKQQQIPFSLVFLLSLYVLCPSIFLPPVALLCLLLCLHPSATQPQGTSSMDLLALRQPACSLWGGWLFGGFVKAVEGGFGSL